MPKDDKSEISRDRASDIVGYDDFLRELKTRISNAQVRAAVAVNKELVLLYWQIGQDILHRQQQQGWGAKVINRLAADLQQAFPQMKGFSRTNLMYMRAFAEAYPDEQIVQQVVGQIPWGHNIRILDAVKDPAERFVLLCLLLILYPYKIKPRNYELQGFILLCFGGGKWI